MKALGATVVLLLSACAGGMLASAQSDCTAFGFQSGTDAFAACVERAYAAWQQRSRWRNAGQPAPPLRPPPAGVALYKSQIIRGTSRICTYDHLGSPYVITIGVAQSCPLSIP